MQSSRPDPELCHVPGGVLSLSGPALKELLQVVLARGVPLRFKAQGFSMHPFIRDGDVILVSPPRVAQLRPGDVVAFCHPETGKLAVHRIMARCSGGLSVQGDNMSETDGLLLAEDILGLVTEVARNGRQVRLGRGPERRLIAWLARHGLLQPLVHKASKVLDPLVKGYSHE